MHSDRPIPNDDADGIARREGVSILMNKRATATWRPAGEDWRAVSSRLVVARLKWTRSSRRGSKETFLPIFSAYAPTARAPPEVKCRFLEDLQDVVDVVPYSDFLILLGDFNARVGVFNHQNNLWRGVVGRYGIEERNHSGENFLQFCEHNQLTEMNTCFQKKLIHYGTWMHPATKLHHIIDVIVMRSGQRMSCLDV